MPVPMHGGQLQTLSERFGIPVSELLDFSANINPEGPPPAVLMTLRASLDDLSVLTNYPDLEERDLKQAIARYAGIAPQNVVVANGFVPLLETVLRTLPIRKCLLPVPAFFEYRKTLERAQIEIVPFPLVPESDFAYDADAILASEADAILLANPQNPSGALCSREIILRIVQEAAAKNIYILLDEAFIDYAPEHSLISYIDRFPNLIVFRSVTKFHGIPGLRVAYAGAGAGVTTSINENLPPWPITILASRAVSAALGNSEYAHLTRVLNQQRKTDLQAQIEALGIHVYPSAANYLLLRLPTTIDPIDFWQRMITDHHIVLRSCANYEALSPQHFRIAIRTQQEYERLIAAMKMLYIP